MFFFFFAITYYFILQGKFQDEVSAIHDYLVRAGYINVGFLTDRPPAGMHTLLY